MNTPATLSLNLLLATPNNIYLLNVKIAEEIDFDFLHIVVNTIYRVLISLSMFVNSLSNVQIINS